MNDEVDGQEDLELDLSCLRNFVAIGLLVEEVEYEYLIEVDVVNGAVVERSKAL